MKKPSWIGRSAKSWLQVAVEARRADAPPLVGWPLAGRECGADLASRGPEMLRDCVAQYGDTFSLRLGGQLVTVCQDERFVRTFYGGTDEDVAPFDARLLDERLRPRRRRERQLLRHEMPLREGQRMEELVQLLSSWMREMNAALPVQERMPDEHAATMAMDEMAALGALCLIRIRQDAELLDQVRKELRFLVMLHGPGGAQHAVQDAPLFDACLSESQRLYAPALHFRKTRRVMQAGRFLLPAGRVVACSPYLLHRDRRHYTDPDSFRPERFFGGTMLPGGPPQVRHYVPFGRGRYANPYLPRLRTLLGSCLAHALLHWEMTLSCEGSLTEVRWGLTTMARPAGERWLCYQPRLVEQKPSRAGQVSKHHRVTRSETRLRAVREPSSSSSSSAA